MPWAVAHWRGTTIIFQVPPLDGSPPFSALCYEQQPSWHLQTPISVSSTQGCHQAPFRLPFPVLYGLEVVPLSEQRPLESLTPLFGPSHGSLSFLASCPCLKKHCSILSFCLYFCLIFVRFCFVLFFDEGDEFSRRVNPVPVFPSWPAAEDELREILPHPDLSTYLSKESWLIVYGLF